MLVTLRSGAAPSVAAPVWCTLVLAMRLAYVPRVDLDMIWQFHFAGLHAVRARPDVAGLERTGFTLSLARLD